MLARTYIQTFQCICSRIYLVRVVVDRPIWMNEVFTEECVVMNLNSNPSARVIFYQHFQEIDKLFNGKFIDSIFF